VKLKPEPPQVLPQWLRQPPLPSGSTLVVGLRQNRHATDTTRACIQELVKSTVDFRAKFQAEPVWAQVNLSDNLRLDRIIGTNPIVPGWRLEQLEMMTSSVLPPERSVHDHR
jgi:hypothetical protein